MHPSVRDHLGVYVAELHAPCGVVVIQGEGPDWTVTSDRIEEHGALEATLHAVMSDCDPAFVSAVAAAVRSDTGPTGGRTGLTVRLSGPGERRFHLSPTVNRESIAAHGLDWDRMQHPGIAGSPQPECHGVYLCDRSTSSGRPALMVGD
jgi:hypothetical protein